jgi:peptide/nickel transport system permease protein
VKTGEAFLDIVWQQFRKNRLAYGALYVIVVLFLVAICAPLLASEQPFYFVDSGQTYYPWFVALSNPAEVVDFIFNMALLACVPALIVSTILWCVWRRRQVPAQRRVLRLVGMHILLLIALCLCFGLTDLKPTNKYFTWNFKKIEAATQGKAYGFYTLIPYGPTEQNLTSIFKEPLYSPHPHSIAAKYWLGTDDIGRDVLARMLYGARISLTVGFISVTLYITIGIVVGALVGYFGGWVDILSSRVIEIIMMFPSFFLILTLVGLLGPSLYIIMFVIGITGWPGVALLIRGEFLRQRGIDYVMAARALGASHMRIMFRQILPNALAPAFVSAPFGIAGAIVTEAGLSVLGFGVRPPTPTWVNLLSLATQYKSMWWLVVFPSLAIFISVTVYNLVGSALRDAADPRLRI